MAINISPIPTSPPFPLFSYTLTRYEPPRLVELRGESKTVTAVDTIVLSPNKDDNSKTDVDYTADITLKGWRRPFVAFIGADLEQLGRKAMLGMEANITPERIAKFLAAEGAQNQH